MDIYWIKDKKKCGPATVPDVVSLIQMGELTPDTKGWHTGVEGWKPLRELPALADFLTPKEPAAPPAPSPFPLPSMGTPNPQRTQPVRPQQKPMPGFVHEVQVHLKGGEDVDPRQVDFPAPGLRLLARMVDTAFYFAAGMGVLYLAGQPYDGAFSPASLLFWVPMWLLEAYLLHTYGTTPGKKMLGIHICTIGPETGLSYRRAFLRTAFVFILGVGMMLPTMALLMMVISYFVLRSKGITWWDVRALTLPVRTKRTTGSRIALAIGCLYFSLALTSFFMQPWIEPIYNDLVKVSPEMARMLEPYLPEHKTGSPQPTQQEAPAAEAPAPQQ